MEREPRQLAGIGASDLPDLDAVKRYVGPPREVIVDGKTLRVQDGSTPGGLAMARDGANDDITDLLGPGGMGVRLRASSTTLAAASDVDLGRAPTLKVTITGTGRITSFGTVAHALVFLHFTDAATLAHDPVRLILPGGADLVTAAGDAAIATSDASGSWRVRGYQRASGKAIVPPTAAEVGLERASNTSDADKVLGGNPIGDALAARLLTSALGTTALLAPGAAVARPLGTRFLDRVNLFDFCDGRSGGATPDAQVGFRRALAYCVANRRRRIVIPDEDFVVRSLGIPGYTADASRVGLLVDAAGLDLEICGEGGRLLWDGTGRATYGHTLAILGAGHVRLTGSLSLGFVRPAFVQGVCTAIDTSGKTATFSLEAAPSWTDVQRLSEYDPTTGLFTATVLERPDTFAAGRALIGLGGSSYRLDFRNDASALGAMGVGKTYVLMHQIYACNSIEVASSRSLHIDGDWRVRHGASFALSANLLDRLCVGRGFTVEPTAGAMLALPSDGIHVNNIKESTEIYSRRLAAMCDDAINVSTLWNFSYGTVSPGNRFQIGNATGGSTPEVGDRLAARIASSAMADLGTVVATDYSVYPPAMVMSQNLPSGFASGQLVTNAARSAPVTVDVGTIENIRGNAVVARSSRGVSIRGTLKDCTDGGVVAIGYSFPEGPYPSKVRIDVTCDNVSRIHNPAVWVGSSVDNSVPVAPAGSTRDVSVRARVSRCATNAVVLQSVQRGVVDLVCSETALNPAAGGALGDKTVLIDTCDGVIVNAGYVGGTGSLYAKGSTNVASGSLVNVTRTDAT